MSIIPFWVKLLVVAAIAAAALVAFNVWKGKIREEGREEIRAEWRAAIKKQELLEVENAKKAEAALRARDEHRDKEFAALRQRNLALRNELDASCVDPLILAGMRDAVRAANQQAESSRKPQSDPAAPAGTPTGSQVTEWFTTVAEMYRKCREQVMEWVKWDDRRVAQ